VTSRHSSTIEREFEMAGRLEIRASDHDIRRYLEDRIKAEHQLVRLVQKYPDLQENIISTILEKAKGMSVSIASHDREYHMHLLISSPKVPSGSSSYKFAGEEG
jgi:hypothetical protein